MSPGPFGHSPPGRKDVSRISKVKSSASYFDPLQPGNSRAHTLFGHFSFQEFFAFLSLLSQCWDLFVVWNLSPLRAALLIPTPTFNHFQRVALTSQSTPDSLSPPSSGYHEFQNYSHELSGDLRLQHPVSQAIPVDGPCLMTTQFNDICGANHPSWNEYDRPQGFVESLVYPRSLPSHPPAPNDPVSRLAHRPEQTTTSSLPPMSHDLGTPTAENPSSSYFHSSYEDRAAGTIDGLEVVSEE